MFDPTALPKASSGLPSAAAIADTNISGADVPKPTTIIPISKLGIPAYFALTAAPSTKRSALQISNAKPTKMARINKVIVLSNRRVAKQNVINKPI
jgi:hypothetical protein